MLALFEPGNEPVPWLGNLLRLGPLDDLNATSQEPFPVKLLGKCFSSTYIIYIQGRNHGENLGSTFTMVGKICPLWLG